MGSMCLLSDGGLPSVSCVNHYSRVRSFVIPCLALAAPNDRTPHHAAAGQHPLSARGSMVALSVQTFAPNVSLLVLLALLDRLVLSPMITRRLGGKAARRADG